MYITLKYNFDNTLYKYDATITWDMLYDYFEFWDGALPKELFHLINFDTLEADEIFLDWLKKYCKDKAKEAFDEEYAELLDDCTEELMYELDDNPPTSSEDLMKKCKEVAEDANIKVSDLYERLAFHYNLD